jgi:hypothetical protein
MSTNLCKNEKAYIVGLLSPTRERMLRSNIAVGGEVASKLSEMSKRDGKTAYALANDCLGAALRVIEEGGAPEEIYGAWKMNHIGKDIGALQWVGRGLLERFVEEFGRTEPEKFSQMWRDAGFNFGVYLQMCFPTIEDVVTLVAQLERSFNIGRVKFIEKPPAGQHGESTFSLEIVSANSAQFLKFLGEYWHGALKAYGLEVVDSNIALGVLRVRFVCSGILTKADPQSLVKIAPRTS